MSGGHRIEVSPNNRAVCKSTECKSQGIKIQKGQMRYGTFINGPDFQSWAWKHWGCVTPKQISNLKDSVEGDPSQLDGYEELPEEFQGKVVRAVEQGHIDDEDWAWDIEMNREGKNGYFTAETKRRKKAEAQALKEGSAEEDNASPSKTDNKKRGRVKEDQDAEDAENGEPPAKKTKTRTKKEPKIKNEDADAGFEKEASAIKNPKSRAKKEPQVKNEDVKTRSENEGPASKKTKAATRKGKKANVDKDFEQDVQPVKKGRKQAKKATAGDETPSGVKDESSDHDTLPSLKEKKKRASRKAATSKKVKDEDTETDGVEPASELEGPLSNVEIEHTAELEPEASEVAPKLRKGRKGAPAKATNGSAAKTKKEIQSKTSSAGPSSTGRATRACPA